jgi:hypothetical protein
MASQNVHTPAGCYIGFAFAFKNAELNFDLFGSPYELLAEFRRLRVIPRDAAQHLATAISAKRTFKVGTEANFDGGPYAFALMQLLDATAANNWAEAEAILNSNHGLLTSEWEGASAPLAVYASGGNVTVVRFLARHGAPVNLPGDMGMTALHWAAATGQREVVRELMAHGADASVQNWFLLTPAQLAHQNSHSALAHQLLGGRPMPPAGPMDILKLMGCS